MDVEVNKMKGRKRFIVALYLVLFIFLVISLSTKKAEAILAPDYDFSSAIVKADLIVQGMVIETRSKWIDSPNGKNIFTYVRIRVDRVIKGDPIAGDVEFKVMGGRVGDITQTVSDMPKFHPGEEVIVLLGSEQGDTSVLDALPAYGKVSIEEGKVSWSGSDLAVEKFVEGIEAFIEQPDSDLNQLLKLSRDQKPTADQDDTEATGVGPGKLAALQTGQAADRGNTEEIVVKSPLKVGEGADQGLVEPIKRESISKDASALPDLQPYKRSSWDNKIVISNQTSTGTTTGTIYDDQTIYIDYGCGNYGSGSAGHFRYGLYIDGTRVKYVDMGSLSAGYASYVEDSNIGKLSAGTHTFKVVCDYNYEVSESNEGNNEYSRTFTITPRTQLPDLQPYQRSSWDNKIVISNQTGTSTTAGMIYDDQTVYIDYGCGNYGSGNAGHFRYGLYIDGTLVKYVDMSSLSAGYASYVEDSNVGKLPAGTHTFKVVCDYNNEVGESNEGNNEYSRTFIIVQRGPQISSVSPNSGSAGTDTQVTINGSGFGSIMGSGKVEFWYGRGNSGDPDRIEAPIVSWSNTRIICKIPVATLNQYSASACSGPLRVTTNAGSISNAVTFIVTFSYMGDKWVNLLGVPQVSYRINENTSDCTGEGAAVMAGAATWNNAGAAFCFKYTGTHTNTGVGFNLNNDIMWSNNLPSGVLAQASRWAVLGVMTEADIAFNDADVVWSSDNTPGSNEYDIQSIVAHELGHWLSLRDLYGNIGDGENDIGKVMYGRGSPGDLKRNLHADDIVGIRWIYGVSGLRATIWDCWWTNEVDEDRDGHVRSAKLWWDPDVTGGGGSLTVFEKIYYKKSSSSSWMLLDTTSNHTITGAISGDLQSVDIDGFSHDIYDWKIEVYRSGNTSTDNVRGPDADEDLNDYPMETAQEDGVYPQTPTPISPFDGETVYTLTPMFEWSSFQDGGNGATQSGYQFRVGSDSDGDIVVYDTGFVSSTSGRTHLYTPGAFSGVCPVTGVTRYSNPLEWGKHYHWHARYRDSNGNWSAWSADDPNPHQDFYTVLPQGQLKVNIQPQEAVNAGAMWKLTDESLWHSSGTTLNLPPGNYVIEFKDISGWSKPGNIFVGVAAGQLITITDSYTPALTSLEVIGPSAVDENTSTQYNARAYFGDGSNSYVTTNCTWSENSQYATISSIGVLTTFSVSSNQPARITASYAHGGITKSDFKDITITNVGNKILDYIVIEGPNQVNENSTQDYNCWAYYTDGTDSLVEPNWIENSSYANISSTGLLTTFEVPSDQSCQISATYTFNGVTKSDTHQVTIKNVLPTDPEITSLSPSWGYVGTRVTISGTNFSSPQGSVTFNGVYASIDLWSETQIEAVVPPGATTGPVVVQTFNGDDSNGVTFTVIFVPPGNRADLNGDGKEDILWRYYDTGGYNAVWLRGTASTTASVSGISPEKIKNNAGVVDMGDVKPIEETGEVAAKVDIVMSISTQELRELGIKDGFEEYKMAEVDKFKPLIDPFDFYKKKSKTGEAVSHTMASTVSDPRNDPEAVELAASVNTDWKLCAAGDFNADDKVDLVWRNVSNGKDAVWFMDGVTMTGVGWLPTTTNLDWTLCGTGDFNGDNNVDLVWRNVVNGNNVVWYMDGLTMTGVGWLPTTVNLDWALCGTGDFNNDGKPDLVWRNVSNGNNAVWYMDGVTMTGVGWLPTTVNLDWTLCGTGDFNNDGKVDLLWRNISNGNNAIWYMDGLILFEVEFLTTVTVATWKIEN